MKEIRIKTDVFCKNCNHRIVFNRRLKKWLHYSNNSYVCHACDGNNICQNPEPSEPKINYVDSKAFNNAIEGIEPKKPLTFEVKAISELGQDILIYDFDKNIWFTRNGIITLIGFDIDKIKERDKPILCAKCGLTIHIDDFGGAGNKGIYHEKCLEPIDRIMNVFWKFPKYATAGDMSRAIEKELSDKDDQFKSLIQERIDELEKKANEEERTLEAIDSEYWTFMKIIKEFKQLKEAI